jgi:hypothetical protein
MTIFRRLLLSSNPTFGSTDERSKNEECRASSNERAHNVILLRLAPLINSVPNAGDL